MKKYILLFLAFLLFSLSAQAAISCKSTSDPVVAGKACGQLGETRMLSDGSGLVACVVEDASQTGATKDCTWKDMTSSGGEGGEMCGHRTYLIPGTTASYYTAGGRQEGDRVYYCSYGGIWGNSTLTAIGDLACHGNAVISDLYTVNGTSYTLNKTVPKTGYVMLGQDIYNQGWYRRIYVKPNCPSGYSLKYWKQDKASTSSSRSYLDCNMVDYELVCVKD